MTIATKFPTANTATTGFNGVANNPTNAYADDTSDADFQPSKPRNDEDAHCWSGFDFSEIDAAATLNSVKVEVGIRMSASNASGQWRGTLWADATSGSALTDVTASASIGGSNYTRATTDTTQFAWDWGTLGTEPTIAQLKSSNFGIRIEAAQGNNATAYVYNIDYIKVIVDYTNPATGVTITAKAGGAIASGASQEVTTPVASTDVTVAAASGGALSSRLSATFTAVTQIQPHSGGAIAGAPAATASTTSGGTNVTVEAKGAALASGSAPTIQATSQADSLLPLFSTMIEG